MLDASQVQAEAAKLSYSMLIYTTKTFSGDQNAFNQATRQRLPDQNSIAIGIDVTQRHLSIQSGTNVPLSDSQASDAIDAFRSNFNNGDYTGATIAAIDSLLNTLDPGSMTDQNNGVTGTNNGIPDTNNGISSPDTGTTSPDNNTVPGIIILLILGGAVVLIIVAGVRKGRNNNSRDDDDDDWRGPRGGWRNRNDDFNRGFLIGSLLEESHHHNHTENTFGSGFGSGNFGGGGNFGGNNFGGGAGGSFGGGNTGGGAGGSF